MLASGKLSSEASTKQPSACRSICCHGPLCVVCASGFTAVRDNEGKSFQSWWDLFLFALLLFFVLFVPLYSWLCDCIWTRIRVFVHLVVGGLHSIFVGRSGFGWGWQMTNPGSSLLLSWKRCFCFLKTFLISCSAHVLNGSSYGWACLMSARMNAKLPYEEKWRCWLVWEPSLFIEFLFSYIKYHFHLNE